MGARDMRNSNEVGSSPGLESTAGNLPFDAKGFTPGDVKLLQEAHQQGVSQRGWGRAQFAANAFSNYLAIWDNAAGEADLPTLVIVRFWKTGTYALMIKSKFVATGRTLYAVLPALAAARSAIDTEN